jgi:hypothetical protein
VLPLADLPNAVIIPPLINVTLPLVQLSVPPSCWLFHPSLMPPSFPEKDKIWIWQNEFYLQIK